MPCDKDAYRDALADLLPLGDAWEAKDIPDSVLYKLLFTYAELFFLWDCTMQDLTLEFFPATTTILKENWENELYGPNLTICIKNLPLPLQQQVRALVAKSFAIGGNRVEYYQEIACLFGFELEVTENFPTQFEAKFEIFPRNRNCDPYTKAIRGSSDTFTLTTTPVTLADLGITLNAATERVKITFDGNVNNVKRIARYWESGEIPTQTKGHDIESFGEIRLSRDQALGIKLVATGSNAVMHITEYEHEAQLLIWRPVCEIEACESMVFTDIDDDISAFACVIQSIMPAHLIFNLFVDGKLYAIIRP